MKRIAKAAFAAIPILVALGVALLVGAGFYYEAVRNKPADESSNSALPSEQGPQVGIATDTPLPSPTATPVAEDEVSIAVLSPDDRLPQSGPELNILLLAGGMGLGGSIVYYRAQRQRLKESLKNISIH